MLDGPVVDLGHIVFVDEFGECLAPVVLIVSAAGVPPATSSGRWREEIVAATGGKGGGPVGSVGFEGVGEDGVGWRVAKGFDERFADFFEV
jgi:hypothetical protein